MIKATILKIDDDAARPRLIRQCLGPILVGPRPETSASITADGDRASRKVLQDAIDTGIIRERGEYMVVLVWTDQAIYPVRFVVVPASKPQLEIL